MNFNETRLSTNQDFQPTKTFKKDFIYPFSHNHGVVENHFKMNPETNMGDIPFPLP